jgi:polar amino acid transport system substrate-binding protein
VCDEPVAAHFALRKKEYNEKFKIVGKSFTKEAYGMVVKKGNKELVDQLNKGIKAVKAKKLDVKIHNTWVR